MLLIDLPVGAFESSALSNLWTLNSDTAGSVIRFLELVTFDFTNSRLRHPKLLIIRVTYDFRNMYICHLNFKI